MVHTAGEPSQQRHKTDCTTQPLTPTQNSSARVTLSTQPFQTLSGPSNTTPPDSCDSAACRDEQQIPSAAGCHPKVTETDGTPDMFGLTAACTHTGPPDLGAAVAAGATAVCGRCMSKLLLPFTLPSA